MNMKYPVRKENPIMNLKKGLFCASFSLLCLSAISFSFFNARPVVGHAQDEIARKEVLKNYSDSDFDDETEVDSNKLTVTVTAATKTSTGESLTLNFTTGGTGFQDSTNTYILAPMEPEFATYYASFVELSDEEKDEIKRQYDAGEYETLIYSGEIYTIVNRGSGRTDVVIPKTLGRGIFFKFNVVAIHENVITAAALAPEGGTALTSITIPDSVETIYDNSFPETLPESFEFNVEYLEADIPDTWAANWNHGAKVNYGYTYPSKKVNENITAMPSYGDKDSNFFIGYYPENEKQYPLVMSYKLKGETTTRYFEFEKSKTSSIGSHYDAVGNDLQGSNKILYADIPLDLSKGDEIDPHSVVIHNIYEAKKDSGWKLVSETPYQAHPGIAFSEALDVTDLLGYEFTGLSSFAGYTSVNLIFSHKGNEAYSALKPSFYRQYKDRIAAGTVYVRYRFASLSSCSFGITYEKGGVLETTQVPIQTPVNYYNLAFESGNNVSFLLKNSDVGAGFNATSIRKISFVGFYVTTELYLNGKGIVSKSGVVSRFANFELMNTDVAAPSFDINAFLFILIGAYIVLFLVGSTIYFFIIKEKYKNDEFRRVKPKSYWFKAVLAMFGSLIVILAVVFIVLRCTAMNNAIVVYNPVDAFIIITMVASILIVGYFIKYLVTASKARKERIAALKLKLNEDVDEDGTN